MQKYKVIITCIYCRHKNEYVWFPRIEYYCGKCKKELNLAKHIYADRVRNSGGNLVQEYISSLKKKKAR